MADDVKLPGIPAIDRALPREIRSVLGPIREILIALTNGENRVSRLSDLKGAGLIEDYSSVGVKPRVDLDTTIPPAPTGLSVDAALSNVILSWDLTTYKNLAFTEVWRATSNNFSAAVKIGTAQGTESFYIDNVNHTGTWYYWIRYMSKAGIAGSFNAQAGTAGTTGVNPDALLELLTGQPDSPFFNQFPFIILAVDTTINGVLCPAGVYMRDAYIANGTITNAKIANLAVDDAKIVSLTAGKITAGTLAAGVIYAGAINASQVTAGTMSADRINGGTFSGASIDIGSSAGGSVLSVANNGTVVNYRTLNGYNLTCGSLASPSDPSIRATNHGSSNIEAIIGENVSGGAGAHGVRGKAKFTASSSIATGLVGASNGFDFYADGAGTNYGPFTGAHEALVPNGSVMTPGDIVYDVQCLAKNGWSNTIFEIAHTTTAYQAGAIGVYVRDVGPLSGWVPSVFVENDRTGHWVVDDYGDMIRIDTTQYLPEYADLKDFYTVVAMNGLGEGQINVCGENGDISKGDLIVTSSMRGKGMRQADDIVRGCTVAKAREAVTFSSPEEVKTIACIYLCG